jgi:plasmid stability protein
MEAEARAILTAAVEEESFVDAWLEATRDLRGDRVPLPKRSLPRPVDLE